MSQFILIQIIVIINLSLLQDFSWCHPLHKYDMNQVI